MKIIVLERHGRVLFNILGLVCLLIEHLKSIKIYFPIYHDKPIHLLLLVRYLLSRTNICTICPMYSNQPTVQSVFNQAKSIQ